MNALSALFSGVDVSAVFVAVIGALFSIVSAIYISSRRIDAEFRYRRVELTKLYSENLLKERLRLYPGLWRMTSAYAKLLKAFPVYQDSHAAADRNSLRAFNDAVTQWDNENGLILSSKSARACFRLRRAVRDVLAKEDAGAQDTKAAAALSNREADMLYEQLTQLEIALRVDIGVFEVDEHEARKAAASFAAINRDVLGEAPAGHETSAR